MNTKALRQKILDLAIRGKLVPQDPNDEPASVLLERIRAEKERLIAEGKIKRPKSKTSSSASPYKNFTPPFDIPDSWVWARLEEITSKIGSGSTPRGSNYASDGIPFFRSQNVYNEGLVYDDIKYISPEIHSSMAGTEVKPLDVLLNIIGGSIGRCAVVPNVFKTGNVSQHVCIIRPILIDSEYLHAYFLSNLFWSSMKLTGSGREGLPKYNLEQMLLPFPPIQEQKRMVKAIENFFLIISGIEKNQKELTDVIGGIKSKILELAMQGKLVPQDPADEPAADMLRRINPKAKILTDIPHYPQLPDNWIKCELSNVSELITGSTPPKVDKQNFGNDFPFYKPQDLDSGFVNSSQEGLSKLGIKLSRRIPKDSIAVCCIGTIGKIGYICKDGATNQQINTIVPLSIIDSKYTYYYCKSEYFQNQISSEASAITISIVNKSKMGKILIPIPPLNEQRRIVDKIEELFSTLDKIEESLN